MTTPPEDLVLAAKRLEPRVFDLIAHPQWNADDATSDWRLYVPIAVQRLWGRLGLEARVTAFIVAEENRRDDGE